MGSLGLYFGLKDKIFGINHEISVLGLDALV